MRILNTYVSCIFFRLYLCLSAAQWLLRAIWSPGLPCPPPCFQILATCQKAIYFTRYSELIDRIEIENLKESWEIPCMHSPEIHISSPG
ncbi:hypothetical protein BGZ57DRAFT_305015 [Hyaloscypha finlandica]|nr:hypothetical protein BGZ57DRAFT_305015 [Hyaloscypha finlandica]